VELKRSLQSKEAEYAGARVGDPALTLIGETESRKPRKSPKKAEYARVDDPALSRIGETESGKPLHKSPESVARSEAFLLSSLILMVIFGFLVFFSFLLFYRCWSISGVSSSEATALTLIGETESGKQLHKTESVAGFLLGILIPTVISGFVFFFYFFASAILVKIWSILI